MIEIQDRHVIDHLQVEEEKKNLRLNQNLELKRNKEVLKEIDLIYT